MRRRKMNRRKDRKIFTKTAHDNKKININPIIPRGGIRL